MDQMNISLLGNMNV